MYIIQMSDLHINNNQQEIDKNKEKIKKMLFHIKGKITDTNESILLCICGDVIDNDGKELNIIENEFKDAKQFINIIYDEFKAYSNFKIGMCAGNHDYIKFDNDSDGDGFKKIKALATNDCKVVNFSEKSYIQSFDEENIDFIYVNSTLYGDYHRGNIDYIDLEETLKKCKNPNKILICHHTIMSMDDGVKCKIIDGKEVKEKENPSIINAAALIQIINKYDIKAFMHGHTHGVDGVTIGNNNCAILGVGALFSNNHTDVNSQFNLYKYEKGIFTEAWNCRYNDDVSNTGSPKMNDLKINMLDNMSSNYFTGRTFTEIYQKLINKLEVTNTALYNVSLNGSFVYDDFKLDINENFGKKIELGHTYSELAEMWQQTKCPDELCFNHGEYFVIDEQHGILKIINQLKVKPTSSHAILSTSNFKKYLTKNDNDYVPSFMYIQFGFGGSDRQKIYVNLNLRALEASRFLKINICEVLYLCEILHKKFQFTQIQLKVGAFRVQKDDKFNCFLKNEIDLITPSRITRLVDNKKYDDIIKMLEEKKSSQETIVVTTGLCNLLTPLKEDKIDNNNSEYDNIIIIIEKIIKKMNKLSDLRSESSVPTPEMKELARCKDGYFERLIDDFKKL